MLPRLRHYPHHTQNVFHIHKLFLGRERGGARPGDRAQGPGGRGLDRGGGQAKGLSRQQGKIKETVSKKQSELKTEAAVSDVWGWVIIQGWILEQTHNLWRKEPNVQTELQHQDGWKQKPQAVLTKTNLRFIDCLFSRQFNEYDFRNSTTMSYYVLVRHCLTFNNLCLYHFCREKFLSRLNKMLNIQINKY